MGHPHAKLTAAERFEMKVDRSGECHRWTAARDDSGYGIFWYGEKVRKAHVVALLMAGVEIPDGFEIDHVRARGCKHRDCVRVDHLEPVPHRENVLRGDAPAAINARATVCLRGHELPAPLSSGVRMKCRACQRERNATSRGLVASEKPSSYGHCSDCGGDYKLRADGTLRAHTNFDSRYTGLPFSSRCKGSHGQPATTHLLAA